MSPRHESPRSAEATSLAERLSPRRRLADFITALREIRLTLGWLSLFVPVVILFYWKILLTRQFSLLTGSESVNQAYCWLTFWVGSIRHRVLPLWDPYTFAGHSFSGEMQTAAFYPLHLILALFPLNQHNVFSPYLYHAWWAGGHLLGACFLFLLAREFGLTRFPAFVAGICFALGGFVGRMGWPHMLESSIWLPLIFLFLLRALRASTSRRIMLNACLGGLALGMSILAGGFHVVIMQALVVFSAGVFCAVSGMERPLKAGAAVVVILAVGFAAGAVQWLSSMDYSARAARFVGSLGSLPANQKIPYDGLRDNLAPHGIFMLLMPTAFDGHIGSGEVINPYLGVFPLLAAILGIRRNWAHPWVRYLAGLSVAAFLYAFGPFSWLHGVLYAIVPKLWMAREAPRMVYLADFALALLTAFGIETLLSRAKEASWQGLNRILLALVIACAVCLFVPAVVGKPDISSWISLSIMLILMSYGLFRYLLHGNPGAFAKVLMVGLILFDLGAFDWNAFNVTDVRRTGINHLDRNLSLEGASNFLKSQKGLFRVQVLGEAQPNMGDLFGVPTTFGGGVTLSTEYMRIIDKRNLLNVRYVVRPASAPDPRPVYQDAAWKVYENPGGASRAWLVHETMSIPAGSPLPAFDPSQTALVDSGMDIPLESKAPAAAESAIFSEYAAHHIELKAHAQTRALLVLSETFDPGWHATVNGARESIYRVDGDLRGIVVPVGDSQIVLTYAPLSFYLGSTLTLLAFFGTAFLWTHSRRERSKQVTNAAC